MVFYYTEHHTRHSMKRMRYLKTKFIFFLHRNILFYNVQGYLLQIQSNERQIHLHRCLNIFQRRKICSAREIQISDFVARRKDTRYIFVANYLTPFRRDEQQ